MLVWNVYWHNWNSDRFEVFNIFKHGGFREYFEKHLKAYKKDKDKEKFAESIKKELRYYYWCKCEYEVILEKKDDRILMRPWIGKDDALVLDVTEDDTLNWPDFFEKQAERYIYKDRIKIDIFDQVMYRFDEFINYLLETLKL